MCPSRPFCVVLLTFATLLTLVSSLYELLFLMMATAVWGVMLSHLKEVDQEMYIS